jgi:RNA polymerase sigma-70 factor (ECF subfamily)
LPDATSPSGSPGCGRSSSAPSPTRPGTTRRWARNLRRQVSLEDLLEQDGAQQAVAASLPSPSSLAVRCERGVLLADALAELPPDSREVFVLHHIEPIPFNETAVRMGRSPGASRVLWTRAMRRLSHDPSIV